MRKVLFILGVLLSSGLFSACSSDDGINDLMNDKLSWFESGLQSIPEEDYTGEMCFDDDRGWYIICGHSGTIDSGDILYPLNLPKEFEEEGTKVSFSGKVIEMTDEERESLHFVLMGGHKYYFVYLKNIEKGIEEEIPYRGNPPFTITDMPGVIGYDSKLETWFIAYVLNYTMVNYYYPDELSEEFQVKGGPNVIISGNVHEEFIDPRRGKWQKTYKIKLTKIDKTE